MKETGTEVEKGLPEPSLTVMLTPALPPAEIVAGLIAMALKLRFGGVMERPILAEIAFPEASVLAAFIVVAPVVLPALTVIEAVPFVSVRAVPEAGLNTRSEVVVNVTTVPTVGDPLAFVTIAVRLAGLEIDTEVVGLLLESVVSDRAIEPVVAAPPVLLPVPVLVPVPVPVDPPVELFWGPHPIDNARNAMMIVVPKISGQRDVFLGIWFSFLAQIGVALLSFFTP